MRRLLLLLLMVLMGCVSSCGQRDKPQFPDVPKSTGELGDGKIILIWDVVDDAVSYKIYRSDRADGEYVQLWAGSETTYEDKDVTLNILWSVETYIQTMKGNFFKRYKTVSPKKENQHIKGRFSNI